MNNTTLNLRFRVYAGNGLREASQPVDAGNQDVLQAPVLQIAENLQPEVGPFALGNVRSQYQLVAIAVDAQDIVDCFVLHPALGADLVVHCIQPHNAVDGLQRAVLPGFYLGDNPVGDLRENRVGDVRIVHLGDVRADIAQTHPQPVQADDFVGQAIRQHRLALFNQLRLKAALAILRGLDLEAAG